MKKQQGIVLFFAIIVLLLMTIIGVSLATNSTMSIKMAGAGAERIEALNRAQGKLAVQTNEVLGNDVVIRVPQVRCPRTSTADSANALPEAGENGFICREFGVTETYGRQNMARITVVMGFKNVPHNGN